MTADVLPGVRPATASVVAPAVRQLVAVVVGLVKTVVPHLFTIGGFAALCVAAFTVSTTVGFVAVGLSLFLFEWRLEASRPPAGEVTR